VAALCLPVAEIDLEMADRSLRQLLPRPLGDPASRVTDVEALGAGRRRPITAIACERCRKRKTAVSFPVTTEDCHLGKPQCFWARSDSFQCDGARPQCGACASVSNPCSYRSTKDAARRVEEQDVQITALRQQLDKEWEILYQLMSSPDEDQAVSLLRRLRASVDPVKVLSAARGRMSAQQRPSDIETNRGLMEPTESQIEAELMQHHPRAYAMTIPLGAAALEQILKPLPSLGQPQTQLDNKRPTSWIRRALSDTNMLQSDQGPAHSPYDQPPPSGQYCDSRLNNLDIGYWTRVPITNEKAAAAISYFLETDHASFPFFDAELFLDDLTNHRPRFCSALLVSALLGLACVGALYDCAILADSH
jgi:hypothetical protein